MTLAFYVKQATSGLFHSHRDGIVLDRPASGPKLLLNERGAFAGEPDFDSLVGVVLAQPLDLA